MRPSISLSCPFLTSSTPSICLTNLPFSFVVSQPPGDLDVTVLLVICYLVEIWPCVLDHDQLQLPYPASPIQDRVSWSPDLDPHLVPGLCSNNMIPDSVLMCFGIRRLLYVSCCCALYLWHLLYVYLSMVEGSLLCGSPWWRWQSKFI